MAMVLGFRHALVENPRMVVYGRLPGFPLAAHGREEAEQLGKLLASAPVTVVYASPLERAVQTAKALAAPHGLEVRTDERLLEWEFWARYQGQDWQGIAARVPDVAAYEQDPGAACPEEPLADIGKRVLEWASEAAEQHDGAVFGVSHEAPLAAAYVVGRGGDFGGFRAVNVPHLGCVRLEPGPPELADPVAALHC
jgi:broad specificity phosphatase PhoE